MRRYLLLVRCFATLLVAWLALLVTAGRAGAQDDIDLERAVKATYLYKFAPFVDWPDRTAEFPAGAFRICVIGGEPFGDILDRAIQGQTVAGRPIAVQRLTSAGGTPACSVMYVGSTDPQSVARSLAAVRGMPVLTVTDSEADATDSGIINFVVQDHHVRFEIDDRAAAANHLTISSKLLGLATRVTGRTQSQ